MEFVTQWFWYLVAFLVGALVAWAIVSSMIKARTEREALQDLDGARVIGGQR